MDWVSLLEKLAGKFIWRPYVDRPKKNARQSADLVEIVHGKLPKHSPGHLATEKAKSVPPGQLAAEKPKSVPPGQLAVEKSKSVPPGQLEHKKPNEHFLEKKKDPHEVERQKQRLGDTRAGQEERERVQRLTDDANISHGHHFKKLKHDTPLHKKLPDGSHHLFRIRNGKLVHTTTYKPEMRGSIGSDSLNLDKFMEKHPGIPRHLDLPQQ